MTTQTQDSDVLLTMTDVSKSFPGVKALDHANLTVRSHSVHALMGENGAGKSTFDIIKMPLRNLCKRRR